MPDLLSGVLPTPWRKCCTTAFENIIYIIIQHQSRVAESRNTRKGSWVDQENSTGVIQCSLLPNQICFRACYFLLPHLPTNQKIQLIHSTLSARMKWTTGNGIFMSFFMSFSSWPIYKKSIPLFSIPDSTFHIPPESAEYFL